MSVGLKDARCKLRLEESNMALVGSDIERKVKEAAAQGEQAWQGCGQAPGVEVWRIEKFKVAAWPKERYGEFYDGDSYIVLHTQKKKDDGAALMWDIHFWLGTYTTQDEAGTAAYKTVELDDFFHGAAVQYRHVQGSEAACFLELFKGGLKITPGGIDSGFRHVTGEEGKQPARLYTVAGPTMRTVRVTEIAAVSAASLCEADAFVLDSGDRDVFIFQGAKCSPGESSKASQFADTLVEKKPRGGRIAVVRTGDAPSAFWALLGGEGPVAEETEGAVAPSKDPKALYRVTDSSGTLETTVVAEGAAVKGAPLDATDCYILLEGKAMATVWVGGGATAQERRGALHRAQLFAIQQGNAAMGIVRAVEGREPAHFTAAICA